MTVRVIADSSIDVREEIRKDILIVPAIVRFGKEEFRDGIDLSYDELYQRMEKEKVMPETSQANPAAFEEAYKTVEDEAIVITISSKLSGMFQSASIAAEEYKGRIYVIDSLSGSIGAGILAERALRKIEEGKGAAEIYAELEEEKKDICLLGVLDTLQYLKRSGRISALAATAGDVLSIKPLLSVKDGLITAIGKARGSLKAYKLLKEEIAKAGIDITRPIYLAYAGLKDDALQKLMDSDSSFREGRVQIARIGTAVGSYLGPGALLAAFFRKPSHA